jgi:Trk K+ transport system NAD-binding subunit
VDIVLGHPASARTLAEAAVARADAVIVCGLERLDPDEADAQVL